MFNHFNLMGSSPTLLLESPHSLIQINYTLHLATRDNVVREDTYLYKDYGMLNG